MMLRRKIILALVIADLLLFSVVCFGQDTSLVRQNTMDRLYEFSNSETLLRFKRRHYPSTQGQIVADLVLKGRKVETVFVVSSTVEPMMFNNAFCNFLKDMEFEFKLPKGQREKVRYTFVFTAEK